VNGLLAALLAVEGLELRADHLWADAGILAGEGGVVLILPEGRVEAAGFSYDRASATLRLVEGRYTAEGLTVDFGAASLVLPDGEALLVEARLAGEGIGLTAQTLRRREAGGIAATGVVATRCDCERPPWALIVEAAEGDPEERLILDGARLQLCGGPSFPLPLRHLQVAERTGPGLPEAGSQGGALWVGLPVRVKIAGPAALSVGPRVYAGRGLFGVATLRDPGPFRGEVSGMGGYDGASEALRGALRAKGSAGGGGLRAGVDATGAGDGAWAEDFGADLLQRQRPYDERLAYVAAGPLRLETDRFGFAGPTRQGLGAGVLEASGAVGEMGVYGRGRVDAFGLGADPLQTAVTEGRVGLDLGLSRALAVGPGHLEGGLDGRLYGWQAGPAAGRLRGEGAALLDLWGAGGGLRSVGAIGVFAMAAAMEGEAGPLPMDRLGPAARYGPRLEGAAFGPGGLVLEGALSGWQAQDRRGARSFSGRAIGQAQAGPARLSAQVSPRLQMGEGWLGDETGAIELGLARAAGLQQAWGRLGHAVPGVGGLSLAWAGRVDLRGRGLLEQGPDLVYNSGCDCLFVEAGARWSVDQTAPSLGLRLRLGP